MHIIEGRHLIICATLGGGGAKLYEGGPYYIDKKFPRGTFDILVKQFPNTFVKTKFKAFSMTFKAKKTFFKA